jgi:hypothetical protein
MQHLGSEDQLLQVLRDMWDVMTPEDRQQVWPLEDRLKGQSAEDIVRALSPEQSQRLRQLLESAAPKAGDSSNPAGP